MCVVMFFRRLVNYGKYVYSVCMCIVYMCSTILSKKCRKGVASLNSALNCVPILPIYVMGMPHNVV